jgi:hypothetical protein
MTLITSAKNIFLENKKSIMMEMDKKENMSSQGKDMLHYADLKTEC